MVGIELPVLAMEHMYLVTDDMPEVIEFNRTRGQELPHAIDFKAEIYMRQEHNGMVLGTYEKACVPWQPRTTPWEFGSELLPPDLDRITPVAGDRLQAFPGDGARRHQAHHQRPVHVLPGRQSARRARCRVCPGSGAPAPSWRASARAAASGSRSRSGWSTAIRVSTCGPWTSRATASGRRAATRMRKFARTIRGASRSAFRTRSCRRARPQQTTSLYDALLAEGAVMGDSWGLETPLWFAPRGRRAARRRLVPSLERLPARQGRMPRRARGGRRHRNREFREIRDLRDRGAEAFLARLMTNRMPRAGRLVLTPMLNPAGKLIGDFTIACANPSGS